MRSGHAIAINIDQIKVDAVYFRKPAEQFCPRFDRRLPEILRQLAGNRQNTIQRRPDNKIFRADSELNSSKYQEHAGKHHERQDRKECNLPW